MEKKFLRGISALVKIEDIIEVHLVDVDGYISQVGRGFKDPPISLVVSLPSTKILANDCRVDEFPTFDDALEAMSWLGELLDGSIDVDTWNAGRTDKSLRTKEICDAENTEG